MEKKNKPFVRSTKHVDVDKIASNNQEIAQEEIVNEIIKKKNKPFVRDTRHVNVSKLLKEIAEEKAKAKLTKENDSEDAYSEEVIPADYDY